MWTLLEQALIWIGLAIVILSLALYIKRTRDIKGVLVFWSARLQLTPKEFKMNRLGILLMFLGVVLRFVNSIFLW
ncbi:hypothetical protein SAMN05421831_11072 [Allopseudospirillum japonicum]|uniref:Immunity protein 17 n=1 Tax=Allopseudospirillum japonicum TaxID=64971 RepID=A0A1H6TFZ7_9GAMM|nr:hypothetical protein [Allopseudospirillum japonicum]SEI79013.1 hypothetical protein SAMN05421831_11072 [Allopseudospirillum japonicum]